jgi:uncharacterized repeat protein (TIGR02059 family)
LTGIANAPAGTYPLTFNATTVAGTVQQQFTFNLIDAGPVFTTPDKVDWIQGASGSFTIAAQMGTQAATLAITAGSLPSGLSFDPNTGLLSGNAQGATIGSPITLTFTATVGSQTKTQQFTININDEPAPTLNALSLDSTTGNTITLNFTQPLTSATPTAPAGFEVKGDGQPLTINSVAVNGRVVTLTLANAVPETVKKLMVSYTPPSTGPYPLQTDGGTTAASSAAAFDTSLSNLAPELSATTTGLQTPSYTEGAAAVAVLPSGGSFSISDSDSKAISAATVRIGSGLHQPRSAQRGHRRHAGDRQLRRRQRQARPSSARPTPPPASQALLAKVTFSNSGSAPTAISNRRQLSITVRDSGGSGLAAQTSSPITLNLNVVGVNSAPVLDPAGRRTPPARSSLAPRTSPTPAPAFPTGPSR